MQTEQARPIPDSYWVQPDRLLAGEYPKAPHNKVSWDKLNRLLEAGVTLFIDLTEAEEYNQQSYAPLLQKQAATLGRAVEHRRMPIPDRGTPTPAEMKRILDTIDAGLEAGQMIYVHCFGGIGRTGTVIGCHLVRHGMQGEAALAEIARWRQGTPKGWLSSPETEAQRQMVCEWSAGG